MSWTSLSQVFSPLSGNSNYDGLIWQNQITYNYQLPAQTAINFSFDAAAAVAVPDTIGVTALTTAQQAEIRGMLDYVHQVTGINFNETTGNASAPVDLYFGYSGDFNNGWYGVDYQTMTYAADTTGAVSALDLHDAILLNSNYEFLNDPSYGSLGYEVILHELGHALGLKNGEDGPNVLPSELDHPDLTIMSQTVVLDPGPQTLSNQFNAVDKLALNWLYGGDGLLGTYGLTVNSSGVPTAGGLNPAVSAADTYRQGALIAAS